MKKGFALDIGRTNTYMALWKDGKIRIPVDIKGLAGKDGAIPSYVAFTQGGEVLIGEAARQYAKIDPKNVIYDFLYTLGKKN